MCATVSSLQNYKIILLSPNFNLFQCFQSWHKFLEFWECQSCFQCGKTYGFCLSLFTELVMRFLQEQQSAFCGQLPWSIILTFIMGYVVWPCTLAMHTSISPSKDANSPEGGLFPITCMHGCLQHTMASARASLPAVTGLNHTSFHSLITHWRFLCRIALFTNNIRLFYLTSKQIEASAKSLFLFCKEYQ